MCDPKFIGLQVSKNDTGCGTVVSIPIEGFTNSRDVIPLVWGHDLEDAGVSLKLLKKGYPLSEQSIIQYREYTYVDQRPMASINLSETPTKKLADILAIFKNDGLCGEDYCVLSAEPEFGLLFIHKKEFPLICSVKQLLNTIFEEFSFSHHMCEFMEYCVGDSKLH